MSQERLSLVKEQLFQLERKIRPLEWDMNRNQINEFRKMELTRLKEEQIHLREELETLEKAEDFINKQPATSE